MVAGIADFEYGTLRANGEVIIEGNQAAHPANELSEPGDMMARLWRSLTLRGECDFRLLEGPCPYFRAPG